MKEEDDTDDDDDGDDDHRDDDDVIRSVLGSLRKETRRQDDYTGPYWTILDHTRFY